MIVALLGVLVACSDAAEGESCDLANGNDDCEEGLICRGPWDIASKEAVCCPAPPAKPSVGACGPKVKSYEPDPSVDAAPIPPGTGGSSGTGGTGGSGGDDAGDGAAGTAGSDGAAGSDAGDGAAGSDAGDGAAGSDAGDAAADASGD